MKNPLSFAALATSLALATWNAAPSQATWSIVAVDTETLEVAVGSATCVTGIDLAVETPVVVVGKGAGAAQSLVDSSGQRRRIMSDGFLAGSPSDTIMAELIALPGSNLNQEGVASTLGDAATFSGASTFAHSSGVIGQAGSLHYAIQGNVLTGRPVVEMAEAALRDTAGDLPTKLMAAMEAARAMGGDGRCSCPGGITTCGSPPPSFTKSADVGYMILARFGDTDDDVCNAGGCADGDYFLTLNVPNQSGSDPDPVEQLQTLFDAWRSGLENRPDAVATAVSFLPEGGDVRLRLELYDWRGQAVTLPASAITVTHAPDSAGQANIGAVTSGGGNSFDVILSGGAPGADQFLVTIDDGIRQVTLPPTRTVLPDTSIFADGFETGDTSRWTN